MASGTTMEPGDGGRGRGAMPAHIRPTVVEVWEPSARLLPITAPTRNSLLSMRQIDVNMNPTEHTSNFMKVHVLPSGF